MDLLSCCSGRTAHKPSEASARPRLCLASHCCTDWAKGPCTARVAWAVPVTPSSSDLMEENQRPPQTSQVHLHPPRLLKTEDAIGFADARAGSAGPNLGTSALLCELEEGLRPPRPVPSGHRKRGLGPCARVQSHGVSGARAQGLVPSRWRCPPPTHHGAVQPKALQPRASAPRPGPESQSGLSRDVSSQLTTLKGYGTLEGEG